jgi:hypothetical protein
LQVAIALARKTSVYNLLIAYYCEAVFKTARRELHCLPRSPSRAAPPGAPAERRGHCTRLAPPTQTPAPVACRTAPKRLAGGEGARVSPRDGSEGGQALPPAHPNEEPVPGAVAAGLGFLSPRARWPLPLRVLNKRAVVATGPSTWTNLPRASGTSHVTSSTENRLSRPSPHTTQAGA